MKSRHLVPSQIPRALCTYSLYVLRMYRGDIFGYRF